MRRRPPTPAPATPPPGPWRRATHVAALLAVIIVVALSIASTGVPLPGAGQPPFASATQTFDPVHDWEVLWLDDGPTHSRLDPDTDYVVMLPDGTKHGHTIIEGGRNIIVPGGHIVLSSGETDQELRAIYIKDATGTVRIQDVFIEGRDEVAFDAVAISAPEAVVELLNIRVEGVRGTYDGFHGDIVQPFGGVKELFVNGLTGFSSYQGFYLQETDGPIGSVTLRNVNLAYDENPEDETTYLLWLNGCSSYPVTLNEVYIEPRPGQQVRTHAVHPSSVRPRDCPAEQDGDEIWWPALPELAGEVIEGTPPGGDFVPSDRWDFVGNAANDR